MYAPFIHKLSSTIYSATIASALTLLAQVGTAAPADEIKHAVRLSGAADLESATPTQFVMAFSSVAIRVNEEYLPAYVTAGINVRKDRAPQITAAALRIYRDKQDSKEDLGACHWADAIVRAAIAAAPSSKGAIVKAALEAEPYAWECILAAAGMQNSGTDTAFFRPAGVDAGSINSSSVGTINPGNFSGQGNVVSRSRP